MTDRAPDHAHEDVERCWEADWWAGWRAVLDADRPAHHDDEERDR